MSNVSGQFDKEAWTAFERSLKQVTPEDEQARAAGKALRERALSMSEEDWTSFMENYRARPVRYRLFFCSAATLEGAPSDDTREMLQARLAVQRRLVADFVGIFGLTLGDDSVGTWPKAPWM